MIGWSARCSMRYDTGMIGLHWLIGAVTNYLTVNLVVHEDSSSVVELRITGKKDESFPIEFAR